MSKSMDQLLDTKADLESYFASDVLKVNPWMSSEWVFVPMVYCEKIEEGVEISQTCEDFVIKGKYFLLTQGAFNNYVDRILPLFDPPPAWTVSIP